MKGKLTSAPLLVYPDFTKRFILTCDASNYAISAILSQGDIGKEKPIAFASRTLNKSECSYSTTEKELLAILFGCKTFRPYLYGRNFLIVTDHRPLKWLFNHSDPSSKLQRWRLKLEEYEYEIIYRKGSLNRAADALSRNPIQQETIHPITGATQPETSDNSNDDLIDLGPLDLSPFDNQCPDYSPLNLPSPTIPAEVIDPLDGLDLSNEDYSEFLKSTTKPITFNTDIREHYQSLMKSSCNAVLIPTSIDLDESNLYIQELLGNLNNSDELIHSEKQLHAFKKIVTNNKIFYLIFTKVYHFDQSTYPDIYKTLMTIRDQLVLDGVTEIAISDLKNPFEKHSFIKIYNMLAYLFHNTRITVNIYHNNIIYPSPIEVQKILKENHDIPIAGHLGSSRMHKRIAEQYYWKGMRNDIENYVKCCKSCQTNKALRKINRAPMQINNYRYISIRKSSIRYSRSSTRIWSSKVKIHSYPSGRSYQILRSLSDPKYNC